MSKSLCLIGLIFTLFLSSTIAATNVKIKHDQLWIDGVGQPQLFGAEIQYFRLRGGQQKNIPREKVLEIWDRALNHAVEAGMNTISFYIPWDFHEYKEGFFDFTGTVDEDGDGNPDYPSRDVITFIKMIEEKGINKIMARPGPYINAEWGFLGFGAIPLWFHEKYPDSHMQNSDGLKTKLYDYHSPDLLRHTLNWFQAVYDNVLKQHMGKNGSIVFLQLDNETNFMWQSIYNHDYGPRAKERYQRFLQAEFLSLENLNQNHRRNWSHWSEVNPPVIPGLNIEEDRAWYQFQDHSIHSYLKKLRRFWEVIGVREPEVIFTLAESYNAMKNGILPNFIQRNDKGKTGLMTMNLYPKTYELPSTPLMNLPFKADHDVKAMDAASDLYIGTKEEWLMGPEIQGGWWRTTPVSPESRLQTYLSTLGHGLKALYIYYFSEGDNWQAHWVKDQILPIYEEIKKRPEYSNHVGHLPHEFWKELQETVDRRILVGIDVYRILHDEEATADLLFFDAPLDHLARPTKHYEQLKAFGRKVVSPHQEFLAKALRVTDEVVLLKDTSSHAPSPVNGIDSILLNAEWAGGLIGYLAQAGFSANIHHWNLNNKEELHQAKIIFYQDAGLTSPELSKFFKSYLKRGGTVVSFLGNDLISKLGVDLKASSIQSSHPIKIKGKAGKVFDAAPAPIHSYEANQDCLPILWSGNEVLGLRCNIEEGTFIQIGALFYDIYNSDWYGQIKDNAERVDFLKSLIQELKISPLIEIEGEEQVVAFGRTAPGSGKLWVTVKSGSAQDTSFSLKISKALIQRFGSKMKTFRSRELMKDKIGIHNLSQDGELHLPIKLRGHGSEAVFIEAVR